MLSVVADPSRTAEHYEDSSTKQLVVAQSKSRFQVSRDMKKFPTDVSKLISVKNADS